MERVIQHCIALGLAAGLAATAQAQTDTRVWRCKNNIYTNSPAEAKAWNCTPLSGGNITIVQGTKVQNGKIVSGTSAAPSGGVPSGTAPASGPRVDSAEQRARDSDARTILEAELRKAEARHAELQREYNNGEPEKIGPEHRNHQKYLDRVADLKAAIARNENDIAGIKRELARAGGAPASPR